jgi:hypothetical protein
MGWGSGTNSEGEEVGYNVEAFCSEPGCGSKIDKGLAHCCGGMSAPTLGGDPAIGCGKYFCESHLWYRPGPRFCADDSHLCRSCIGSWDAIEAIVDIMDDEQMEQYDDPYGWQNNEPWLVAMAVASRFDLSGRAPHLCNVPVKDEKTGLERGCENYPGHDPEEEPHAFDLENAKVLFANERCVIKTCHRFDTVQAKFHEHHLGFVCAQHLDSYSDPRHFGVLHYDEIDWTRTEEVT